MYETVSKSNSTYQLQLKQLQGNESTNPLPSPTHGLQAGNKNQGLYFVEIQKLIQKSMWKSTYSRTVKQS